MRNLNSLEMGFDPEKRFVEAVLYAVQGSYPVITPLDVDPDDAPESGHPPILYKTTDHGASWVSVGQFAKTSGGYRLEWFGEIIRAQSNETMLADSREAIIFRSASPRRSTDEA